MTAPEWVNLTAPEWVNMAAPEWVDLTAPEWVNMTVPEPVNLTNLDHPTGCPLLKDFIFLHEQSCMVCHLMQPTSQYFTSKLQRWFVHSTTLDDGLFSNELIPTLVQLLSQSHMVQLMIYIMSWCHKVLSILHEKQLLFWSFDSTVHSRCVRICLMLNRFRHRKHDFAVYVSKTASIETRHNVTFFIIYLEGIILQAIPHWKFQKKSVHTTIDLVSRSHDENHIDVVKTLPVSENKTQHSTPIGGGILELFNFEELKPFLIFPQVNELEAQAFKYINHLKHNEAEKKYTSESFLFCQMPLHTLVSKLSLFHLHAIAKQHDVHILAHATKSNILESFSSHNTNCCKEYVCVFEPYHKIPGKENSKKY
jgi:hypothetical protein